MKPTPIVALTVLTALVALGCPEDDPPPPPPAPTGAQPGQPGQPIVQPVPGQPVPGQPVPGQPVPGQPVPGQPLPGQPTPGPGLTMVTVMANSTPPGATVTGGERVLGTTPLTTQVPIPTPQPGAPPPTFDFTFTLQGYQPATLQAAPANGQIAITAALAPVTAPGETPAGETPGGTPAGSGQVIEVTGRGGGAIVDNGTATATAEVEQACTIGELRATVRGNHTYNSDLTVTLRSPTGQSYTLQRRNQRNPFRTYRVRAAQGKPSQGRWVLAVRDTVQQDSGRLSGFALRIECQ